jgi:hypothetical protein
MYVCLWTQLKSRRTRSFVALRAACVHEFMLLCSFTAYYNPNMVLALSLGMSTMCTYKSALTGTVPQ